MPITLKNPKLENTVADGWPSLVDMRVIVPGLVHYDDLRNSKGETVSGNVLVKKDALDRMANSLEGKPIVNWDHRKVDPTEYSKGRFQGIITSPAVFNSDDGWYHAKGYVWDEQTRNNIQNGYAISCAYTVKEWGEGGTHNQVPYEAEVLNGVYTHIAVVNAPRYEGARIELLNSVKGGVMGLLSLFRKDKGEEKLEIDLEKTMIPLGEGQADVALSELMNSYRKKQAFTGGLKDDDTVEIDGKRVTVSELKNAHLELKNAEEKATMDKEHKNGVHTTSLKNCSMCNEADEEEKKKKDDEEKKNAADEAEKKTKEEEEKKNSLATEEAKLKAEAARNAAKLEELRNKGGNIPMPSVKSIADLMTEGQSRYGDMSSAK